MIDDPSNCKLFWICSSSLRIAAAFAEAYHPPMNGRCGFVIAALVILLIPGAIAASFEAYIRPILKEFCLDCHSTKEQKGELDLEQFSSLAEVKKHPKIWQRVIEQITDKEMPPKNKPQPTAAQLEHLLAWAQAVLDEVALARAGDPGPVVLRRLSNAEYTYTIRDLTGVASLDPAREFPADGAAGEGFMNVGNALVMSPSLVTKYLDAAKDIASHAMLLPDGIRFSPMKTRRDWTEELLAEIRATYREFTDNGGGTSVNLQGIRFDTKDGGVLPLDKYLATLLEGKSSAPGLSAKYLKTLRETLEGGPPSLLLDPIRARWRSAKPGDSAALAKDIAQWQHALWRFNSVGHIGKKDGPKAWMEPITPLQSRQEVRLKLPASSDAKEITLYLTASDAGDGNQDDSVVWEQPRFVAPGQPPLLLRDIDEVTRALSARRERTLASTAKYLAAAAAGKTNDAGIEADALAAWLNYLGIGSLGPVKIEGYFTDTFTNGSGYAFINGWGKSGTPNLTANSSDQSVRIPGNMKPHSVAVHPSPKLATAVGWRSPSAGRVRLAATIQHAHPECGNGVTWSLELRRGPNRQRLANGIAQGAKEVKPAPIENIAVQPGDLVALLIGPRDANHSCDLTAVDLTVSTGETQWDLAKDVSPNILAGNPHGVWHFYTEPDKGGALGPAIPAGSLLAQWQTSINDSEKLKLAEELQRLLTGPAPEKKDSPDAVLHRQLTSLGGPLFRGMARVSAEGSADLNVRAPSVVEVRVPADLVAGYEFITTGTVGGEGTVQLQVLTNKPASDSGLQPIAATVTDGEGPWYSNNRRVIHSAPIIVNEGSAARKRIESAFDEFRRIFPAALCYTKIVPVDEVVTLTLYYREDHHFSRLMLDDAQAARLDRLWDELHYVSHDALALVDVFEQLWQYATQDADPSVFEPMREPIKQRAAAFRQRLVDTQPQHVDAVLKLADGAYRRPLTDAEKDELRRLYQKLRKQELPHDDAIRLMLARVLVAPAFLYRAEKPGAGSHAAPVNDWELASRLSYFLWSSAPDAELRAIAANGRLREPDVLAAETRRMLRDPRVRRMATEFACAWLHIHGFDELSEKSERHFPTFTELRGAMYEESIRFFTDFFQNDRPVLNILNADYTFLNEALGKHYGIPGITGTNWRRVDGITKFSRGGILGHATTLTKQSGASRTSPILRGNWVSEVLLGEKLPRPPKDVPQLPEDEATETLTVRQLTEKHTTDPRCSGCHARIDAFGFALESFDTIGRWRERDLGDRAIDTRAKAPDGAEFEGINGLRQYLLTNRRDAFLKQFCRKLLGYALGREVQLSDRPLLTEMQKQLKAGDYRVGIAIESIVRSPQFREIRGRETAHEDYASSNVQN